MKNPDSLQASYGFEQMSFLPEPDFNPIQPSPNTLPARCLAMMLNTQSFTHPEFEQITGSWRLSAVIFTLKELGWPVESLDLSALSAEYRRNIGGNLPECPLAPYLARRISQRFLPTSADILTPRI